MEIYNKYQPQYDNMNLDPLNEDLFPIENGSIKDIAEENVFESIIRKEIDIGRPVDHKKKKPAFTKHIKWTSEEDQKLLKLVEKYGNDDWNLLSEKMVSRNARQCRERYQYYLDPNLRIGNWTPEEDQLILLKRRELGPKWMAITQFFPCRTDAMIKTRYNALLRAERIAEKKRLNESMNSKISESKKSKLKYKVAKIIFPNDNKKQDTFNIENLFEQEDPIEENYFIQDEYFSNDNEFDYIYLS